MNKQIQEAIDKAKQDSNFSMFKGEYHFETKEQLLSLLKLVAEDAYLEGYQDDFHLLFCEDIVPDWNRSNFEGYWKTLTKQL